MTADKLLISLAGEEYSVTQLNLGQIEDLSILAVLPTAEDPQEETRRFFQRVVGTISAALIKDNPTMTVGHIKSLAITRDEMVRSYNAILRFSGFVDDDKPKND